MRKIIFKSTKVLYSRSHNKHYRDTVAKQTCSYPSGRYFTLQIICMSSIRNIAIIAHVDHGKTTLVDALLKQSGTMKVDEGAALIMDNNDQERERGITIYSKNTSVLYEGTTINIIDTPGHADFGSEVERVLRMVDSVLLVVDAYEGPMPQTKFVLKKSLELGLKPIVVLNKIDKPTARPDWVIDRLFDLFISLGATDEQADFTVVYAIAKAGIAVKNLSDPQTDISPLFKTIIDLVPPAPDLSDKPLRMQISNLGYDEFLGRLGIGRIKEGTIKTGQTVTVFDNEGATRTGKITKIFTTSGLKKVETTLGQCGDIVTIAGIPNIYVGETLAEDKTIEPLPAITIDEPTLTMEFLVNDSPFMGKEGKFVTSRNLNERLHKELETNVGLKIDFADPSRFVVSGRGELHLGVLIETMRREGYELQVSAPQVITKVVDGETMEPFETLIITVDEGLAGSIIQLISDRKGLMEAMTTEHGQSILEFTIPTRGLLGLKSDFILLTKGEGLMYHSFSHFGKWIGAIPKRLVGSMIACQTGKVMKYGVYKLQDRGPIFVDPQQEIYEGMLVGEHLKGGDITVNLTINKQMTNVRNAGNDEAMRLEPIVHMTLEDALGYIGQDEYVEITPKSIRLRKKYLTETARAQNKNKKG
ncbi:MAG: translational GTPase TypA [Candidatus Absconditabacterales bacterium]